MLDASGATAVMMATALKIFPTSSGSTQRLNRDLQQTDGGRGNKGKVAFESTR